MQIRESKTIAGLGKSFDEISRRLNRSPRKVRFAYRVSSNIILGKIQLWSKLETDKSFERDHEKYLYARFQMNMGLLERAVKEGMPEEFIEFIEDALGANLTAIERREKGGRR